MSWLAFLAAAGAAILLWLVLTRRGGGRDLIAPPGRRPRRLSQGEMERLMDLVGRGEEEEALRQLKAAGHDEAGSRRLLGLMRRLAGEGEE